MTVHIPYAGLGLQTMMVLSHIRAFSIRRALKIAPNVYQLTVRGTNIILILEKEITLIDAGFRRCAKQVVNLLQTLGRSEKEVSLIVLTHGHFDHAGGLTELKELTGAKVATHRADISDGEDEPAYPRTLRRLLRLPSFSSLRRMLCIEPGCVDIFLEGGEVLSPLGGLKVIHTPGHTPGSVCLYSPKSRLLIVGDALNKGNDAGPRPPPNMVSDDPRQAMESIKRLADLDFDTLCFGHGRPIVQDARRKLLKLVGKLRTLGNV